MTAQRKLSARKLPAQGRSQETVQRILDAAAELLIEARSGATGRITTNHIAKRAGLSVGSLYQYFPNTEAIVYELYLSMLAPIQKVLDDFDSEEMFALPRETFFERFNRAMVTSGHGSEFVFAMFDATKKYPALASEGQVHASRIANRVARFLQQYGSTWPRKKLERLALYAYYVDEGTWSFRGHERSLSKEAIEWELKLLNVLFAQCFDD